MENKVRFSLDYLVKINYAVYANSLNIIRRMHIENHGEADLPESVLTISALPAVIAPYTMTIPRLPAGKSVDLGEIHSELSTEFILSLTEPVKGEMTVALAGTDLEEHAAFPFEVLPFDQWAGYQDTPEILAAFSTPNHPAVKNILVRAADILKEMTGSGSFTGYQSKDPNQVLRQVSAIYSAVCELNLHYLTPPAGFARDGQRIRLSDEITEKGFATCLDLTLLFSSLLETAGLYPVVLLMDGHSLPGVWLVPEIFPETINYDSTAITRRLAMGMNQIAIFESTFTTKAGEADFNQSVENAQAALEAQDCFILSLDIRRARNLGIKPLPVRIFDQGRYVLAPRESLEGLSPVLPKELISGGTGEIPESEKLPKQKVWERKLLDLSLRNALINYRPEKSGIPLAIHDLAVFSKSLLNDAEFSLLHKPDDWTQTLLAQDGTSRREAAAFRGLAGEEYSSGRIRALLSENELEEKGQKLVRGAKSAFEETGASSLYLGFGLLKWYSLQDPETPRYAPLVLIPAEAETRGHLAGLTLRAREEDGHFNITLLELLKNDFGIELGGLDPLPAAGEGIDFIRIFSRVRQAILREKKWDVLEEVNLGLFSFSKFIMWNDLSRNLPEFRKNKIVDSLINGQLTFQADPIVLSEPFLDDVEANRNVIYPVSADASQSLAVLASAQGKSFVLHGPPGTGKSQTITNIIANALLEDKRVLFVAQKMAALEVVEKRLNKIGIGSFCLELHSNKARKKAVLDQLEASMKIQRIPKNTSFAEQKEEVRARKAELNEVVKKIYAADETGYSIYDLICENTKLSDFPKFIDLKDFEMTKLKEKEAALDQMVRLGAHAGGPYGHLLRGVGNVTFRPMLKEDILSAGEIDFSKLSGSLTDLLENSALLQPVTFQEAKSLPADLRAVLALGQEVPSAARILDLEPVLKQLKAAQADLSALEQSKIKILEQFSPEFLQADPARLERDFKSFEQQSVFGRLLRKNPAEKEMAMLSRTGTIDKTKILGYLSNLGAYQAARSSNTAQLKTLAQLLPEAGSGEISSELLGKRAGLVETALAHGGSKDRLTALLELIESPGALERLERYERILESQSEHVSKYLELTALNEKELGDYEGDYFAKLGQKVSEINGALDQLRDWLIYQEAANTADEMGLSQFTGLYYSGKVSDRELLPAFKKSVLRHELRRRLDTEDVLLKLTGHSLDEKAEILKQKLEEMELLERKELYLHLAGKVPNLVLEKETSR